MIHDFHIMIKQISPLIYNPVFSSWLIFLLLGVNNGRVISQCGHFIIKDDDTNMTICMSERYYEMEPAE